MTDERPIFCDSADRMQTVVRGCIAITLAVPESIVLGDLMGPWLASLHGGLLAGRVENIGFVVGIAAGMTVALPPTMRWREILWICVAAIVAGSQAALAHVGAAALSAHFQPDLAKTPLPGLVGMLAAAPVTLGTAIYFMRRRTTTQRRWEKS